MAEYELPLFLKHRKHNPLGRLTPNLVITGVLSLAAVVRAFSGKGIYTQTRSFTRNNAIRQLGVYIKTLNSETCRNTCKITETNGEIRT